VLFHDNLAEFILQEMEKVQQLKSHAVGRQGTQDPCGRIAITYVSCVGTQNSRTPANLLAIRPIFY